MVSVDCYSVTLTDEDIVIRVYLCINFILFIPVCHDLLFSCAARANESVQAYNYGFKIRNKMPDLFEMDAKEEALCVYY